MGVEKDALKVERLEHEIERDRVDMGAAANELARRGRRFANPRTNPFFYTTLVVVLANVAALFVWRFRARRRPSARAAKLGMAIRRARLHPERIATPAPSVGRRVAGAALSAAAGIAVKRALRRAEV
jgi:hypothetical protein